MYRAVGSGVSGLGLPPGAAARPGSCGTTGDFVPLHQMLYDLEWYSGPISSAPNDATFEAVCAFAQYKGMPEVCSWGIEAPFCEALMAEWETKIGAGIPAPPTPGSGLTIAQKIGATKRAYRRAPAAPAPPPDSGMPSTLATTSPGALDRMRAWWAGQSLPVKAAVVGGSVAVVGGGIYLAAR